MDSQQHAGTFTVTCEAHDEAVVHCLNALAYYSEHVAEGSGARGVAQNPPLLTPPTTWARESGQVTFHFSDARRRGVFLGEATRLLSGKWIRFDMN